MYCLIGGPLDMQKEWFPLANFRFDTPRLDSPAGLPILPVDRSPMGHHPEGESAARTGQLWEVGYIFLLRNHARILQAKDLEFQGLTF